MTDYDFEASMGELDDLLANIVDDVQAPRPFSITTTPLTSLPPPPSAAPLPRLDVRPLSVAELPPPLPGLSPSSPDPMKHTIVSPPPSRVQQVPTPVSSTPSPARSPSIPHRGQTSSAPRGPMAMRGPMAPQKEASRGGPPPSRRGPPSGRMISSPSAPVMPMMKMAQSPTPQRIATAPSPSPAPQRVARTPSLAPSSIVVPPRPTSKQLSPSSPLLASQHPSHPSSLPPWDFGPISRIEAEEILSSCNHNSFLIRDSSIPGHMSFSTYRVDTGAMDHSLIQKIGSHFRFEGHETLFTSLHDLVNNSGVFDGFYPPSSKEVLKSRSPSPPPSYDEVTPESGIYGFKPQAAQQQKQQSPSIPSIRPGPGPASTNALGTLRPGIQNMQIRIKFPSTYPLGSKMFNLDRSMTIKAAIEYIVVVLKRQFPQATNAGIGLYSTSTSFMQEDRTLDSYATELSAVEFVEYKYKENMQASSEPEHNWNGQVTDQMWKNPELEGELGKMEAGLASKKWKNRWFILQHNKVFMFKSKPNRFDQSGKTQPVLTIYLRNCSIEATDKAKASNCMEIIEKSGKSHTLQAANAQEQDVWIRSIKEASCKRENAPNSLKHSLHIDMKTSGDVLNDLISHDDPEKIFTGKMEPIGEGGLADVFLATDSRNLERVALKIMEVKSESFGYIVHEIINHKMCHHPNVVDFKDAYFLPQKKQLWVALEYMPEGDLTGAIEKWGVPFEERKISYISSQVLNALEFIHEMNRLHRDVKSDNILIGRGGVFKLADFGAAIQLSDGQAAVKSFVGSPYWMAPEILREVAYGKPVDVWSFGCLVLEMIEGSPPYYNLPPEKATTLIAESGIPAMKSADKLSPDLKDFLGKCLAFQPEDRWTVSALLQHPFIQRFKAAGNPFIS